MSNDSPVQDTVTTAIKERLTSRFGAAVVFAWCAWNYKLLIVAFSDAGFEKKITYISESIYKNESVLWYFAGGPLLSAFAYVIIHAFGEAMSKSFDKIWRAPWSWILIRVAKREYVPIDELVTYKSNFEGQKKRLLDENQSLRSRSALFESSFHSYVTAYESAIERYVPHILNSNLIDRNKTDFVFPGDGYAFPKPEKKDLLKKHGIPRAWVEVMFKYMDSDVWAPGNEVLASMLPLGSYMAIDVLVYFGIVEIVPNTSSTIKFRVNKAALFPLANELMLISP